ncbi:MAG: type I restriction endonuclease subunit R [Cyanothece sp. SIO1E1]|nr:type I restriction endonuclease subunit R [Cyanothece sp. SIO1E1]
MVQTVYAREISLYELEENFHVQLVEDPFVTEWLQDLPSSTEHETQTLERIRSNYQNLIRYRSMSEEAVKMVVLSPLLDLAGFYQPPFAIETETSIKVTAEDEGVEVKGNIDVLVVHQRFWLLVVESKGTRLDVMIALPQALAHMLAHPIHDQPTYGLLVNGREFVFVKLTYQGKIPKYSVFQAFSLLKPESDLHSVLHIFRRIAISIAT